MKLSELFCRYQDEGGDFCIMEKRFESSNTLRQHISKQYEKINDSKGGKPSLDEVQKAWDFYKTIMKEYRRTEKNKNVLKRIAVETHQSSLLDAADKISLYRDNKKSLTERIFLF